MIRPKDKPTLLIVTALIFCAVFTVAVLLMSGMAFGVPPVTKGDYDMPPQAQAQAQAQAPAPAPEPVPEHPHEWDKTDITVALIGAAALVVTAAIPIILMRKSRRERRAQEIFERFNNDM